MVSSLAYDYEYEYKMLTQSIGATTILDLVCVQWDLCNTIKIQLLFLFRFNEKFIQSTFQRFPICDCWKEGKQMQRLKFSCNN